MAEDDIARLKNRFTELAERAGRGVYAETKFLNMAEQSVLLSMRFPVPFTLDGGYEGAERRIAVFGSEETAGYEHASPVRCLKVSPRSEKFADELSHRDFLGSVMALGLDRSVIGDIVINGNEAYLFCLETAAEHIKSNLSEVRRTSVTVSEGELPETIAGGGEQKSVVIASERLDALIAAVWKLPREEAKALCEKGLVFVNARQTLKGGAAVPEGAAVSVRGRGRFTYLRVERETKKGKIRALVSIP
jgi:RNA-binding protein YlmH